jgi:hypothetical protein
VWSANTNDFAVVKIWAAGFVWVGLEDPANYAAIYADSISHGNEFAYGIGHTAPAGTLDFRVRRTVFDVVYNDDYILGAFGTNGQMCSGDSGGPIGVFMPGSGRYAVVGVDNVVPEHTMRMNPNDSICGTKDGATYWANAVTRIDYIEEAIGKACRTVEDGGLVTKQCWD